MLNIINKVNMFKLGYGRYRVNGAYIYIVGFVSFYSILILEIYLISNVYILNICFVNEYFVGNIFKQAWCHLFIQFEVFLFNTNNLIEHYSFETQFNVFKYCKWLNTFIWFIDVTLIRTNIDVTLISTNIQG